ncbi:MAG: TetR/AcrR family transcriptional regulator C-terminal domain-containing protein [Clostridia bacterium]|nr:TetR/AcrR family transcriptional regulator C-terminal domain-containing protein [Clostridia bacterium]MBQ8469712.1 TetR/AcrR family transcriptional regulator C-terminal domain-containing protein [Clostridia bacterium]
MASNRSTETVILESTKDLMRQMTIDKISVTDICDHAGISRRNFYRYFVDKNKVIETIYRKDPVVNADLPEDWTVWDYFPELCKGLSKDRRFYLYAFLYKGKHSFRSYCIEQVYPIVTRDFKELLDSDQLFHFYISHISNMCFDYFVLWLSQEKPIPPEEFARWVAEKVSLLASRQAELSNRPPRSLEERKENES